MDVQSQDSLYEGVGYSEFFQSAGRVQTFDQQTSPCDTAAHAAVKHVTQTTSIKGLLEDVPQQAKAVHAHVVSCVQCINGVTCHAQLVYAPYLVRTHSASCCGLNPLQFSLLAHKDVDSAGVWFQDQ